MALVNLKGTARLGFGAGGLWLIAACGGASEESAELAAEPIRVEIVEPASGATLAGPDARVVLRASGIEIAPITEGRAGTAHHHLYLDQDLTPATEMVPLDNPQIIHMGDGRSEHTFEGLAPGSHRVIAVLADLAHVPLAPLVTDTVVFTVP